MSVNLISNASFRKQRAPGTLGSRVHIPEGRYTAEVQDDFDAVHVSDYQNIIYLYEYAGKEEECYLDDLRPIRRRKPRMDNE